MPQSWAQAAGPKSVGSNVSTSAASAANAASPVSNTLLVVGDSLSAEYGIDRGTGWVALLGQRIREQGWTPVNLPKSVSEPPEIVNASISGETTAGGLTRIADLLARHRPATVVIVLGGNDALRGLDLAASEGNLRKMTALAQAAGARVVLAGMRVPPNYGRTWGEQFFSMYSRVAQGTGASLVPFLLEGFADDLTYFQPDRIHPLAKAHPQILDNLWPVLAKLGRTSN